MTSFRIAAVALVALLLAGCTAVVDGRALADRPGAAPETGPTSEAAGDTAAQPTSEPGSPATDKEEPESAATAPDGPADPGPGRSASGKHVVGGENVSTTWDITPKQDAVILDYDVAEAGLLSFDAAAGTWHFRSGSPAVAQLAEGKALLVAGRGMGRITSMTTAADTTTVTTAEASLADIVENGTMAWEASVDFGEQWAVDHSPAGLRSPRMGGAFLVDQAGRTVRALPRDTSDGLTKWQFKDGDTTYTFQVTPGAGKTDVVIQASRNELTFTATGTVGALRSTGQATFVDGKLATSTVDQDGLGGNLRLAMAAAGAGTGDLEMDVPGLMFKYIVPVGPVPVTMGITAQLIGSVTVPHDASVVFESNFSYTGSAGFTYTGSEVNAKGTLGNMVMDPKAADPVGFIGSTVQAQFGVSFPKVSLSIFEVGLVPSLQPAIYLGTTLTWGPVCKTAYIRSELLLGYDLKAFGVSFANGKETIWEKRRDTKGDSCE